MVSENWKKITIIAVVVFGIILVLIGLMVGMQGLFSFFKFIIISLLILTLIGGVVYVVYLLFFATTYKDIPAQYKRKLYSVTKVMKNEMLGDLYLSGDSKHNRIKLGKYFYMRLNLPKIVPAEGEDKMGKKSKSEVMPIDLFIVQRSGFLNKLFSNPFFILVRPQDHDHTGGKTGSAIFNNVTISGFNLVPIDSEFFTIDRRQLDLDLISALELNYIKETVFEIFKDLDRLVKQSINLDQRFQKEKEKAREMEIPQISQMMGGGGNR